MGQNRHIKLRLSKGPCHFDAIFFSATAEECGVSAGSRVDAAFYLQINEFRGASSVQLQMIDLRPSVEPSGRERECLDLVERLVRGGRVTGKEARRLLPGREQFVALWRCLERLDRDGSLCCHRLPLLRRLAASLEGADSFLRAALGVEVFAERGLIALTPRDDRLSLRLQPGRRADLEQCAYILRLRRILGNEEKGDR